jgi:hypothetical protein
MEATESMARRLEPIMTSMAKAVLANRPQDIEVFCYGYFADCLAKRESDLQSASSPKGQAHRYQETPSRDTAEERAAAEVPCGRARLKTQRAARQNYESTDDEDDDSRAADALHSEDSGFEKLSQTFSSGRDVSFKREGDGMSRTEDLDTVNLTGSESLSLAFSGSNLSQADLDDDPAHEAKIRSMQWKDGEVQINPPTVVLTPEQEQDIKEKTKLALDDPRTKSLFDSWDTDRSGSVDLMEMVVALHKFSMIAGEGSELKKASDALAGAGDIQKAELNFAEFARFVVQFAEETYGRPFGEVVDHMISVSTSTSERVVLASESGKDISLMVAEDEDDLQILKETVKGMEESVVNSVRKLKTVRKVMFKP